MVKVDQVSKKFENGTVALVDLTFEIPTEEFAFIVGPSGAGKTTLLRMFIRDVVPTVGDVFVNDFHVSHMNQQSVPDLRRKVGMVFQDLKLLSDRTVFENVALPLEIVGMKDSYVEETVDRMLQLVGLFERKNVFPAQLSGGEMQRTAIARAMVVEPDLLLADEPTGNLDPATSWEIVKLMETINKLGTTVIMATHNVDIVNSLPHRVIFLQEGRIVKDQKGARYGTV